VVSDKVLVCTLSGLLAGLAGALTAASLQSGVTVIGVAPNSTPSPPSSSAERC
jgi:ribose/xylose/arabinose/galactoside ABC-type transport system permease subunit